MSKGEFLHSPIKAKGCVVCHQLVNDSQKSPKLSAAHPSIALNMGAEQSSTCFKCHVEWEKKFKKLPHAHSAIKENGCTSCHNPHGADNAKLLKVTEFTQELCLSCHKKNENWEKGDEVHGAAKAKLLKADSAALCSKCHEEIFENKDKGSMHTPARNGECLKCHGQHYGEKEFLLNKTYEMESYVVNTEKSFQLCFSCHSPFRSTKFRNGENNLHSLHVLNKDKEKDGKERGCTVCHDPHRSSQEMQIRTSFTYKKVKLPILFQKLPNGGNCTTACHGKKDYDRMSPAINKEGR